MSKVLRMLMLGVAFAPVSAAFAQDGGGAEEFSATEVVIFGKAIGVGDSFANVEISKEEIERLAPGSGAEQVLKRVSGIDVGSSDPLGGGGFDTTITMRGFAKDNIGFSVDGIPNGRTTLGGGAVPNRFLDTANLQSVTVKQSAGEIGSPSRQALVGHIDYITDDPEKKLGARVEATAGSFDTKNFYGRIDTGEIAPGVTAYVSLSYLDWDVWIGNDPGENERFHVDAKLVKEFENGATVKVRSSYNDRDASGYNIVSYLQTPCADEPGRCFFDRFAPTNPAFTLNPNTDGYTDSWTGNSDVDRLYRSSRGNAREDSLTYIDANVPVGDEVTFNAKAYYHTQSGVGRFMNQVDEGAIPDPLAILAAADPDNPELFFRKNAYDMERYGALSEIKGEHNSWLNWKAGFWYEEYSRSQARTWHKLINEDAGPEHDSAVYHTSEDKNWENKVLMFYLSNQSKFLEDKLTVDYGFTYLKNDVDYFAPIHDSDDGLFNLSSTSSLESGILPKVGVRYSITDPLEVFAGYAENVATITDALLEEGAVDPAALPEDMDRSEVYDVGVRYATDNFAIGVQGFFIESNETLAIDAANSLSSQNSNQGKKVKGIEVSFKGKSGDFGLYTSYTHQQHEYVLDPSDIDADGFPSRGFIRDGADLVGIPNDTLFAELTWNPVSALTLGVNLRHVGERAGFYGNPRVSSGLAPGFQVGTDAVTSSDERLPSYTTVGLSAVYEKDHYALSLNVENLTDEKYLSGVAPELLGVDRKWAGRYFIGAPRSVLVTGKVKF